MQILCALPALDTYLLRIETRVWLILYFSINSADHIYLSVLFFLFPSWRCLLCNPTDLIWRKGTPAGAMTSRSLHRRPSNWSFPWFFSVLRYIPGDLCTAPGITLLPLSLADRRDWCDTRGKWPLARNPDKSWWHRNTSLKLSWPQPVAPCKTGW